ncbi:MAG TPA: NADH-quinone oxidoreductase subunit M [Solirubrobacteraceae bacterium]|jgi:NADH-quinone oxidoreductase subunit M
MPALSILIWVPAACGLLGALLSGVPRSASGLRRTLPATFALIGSLAAFGLAIGYIVEYKTGSQASTVTQTLHHVTNVTWIASLGIHYKLGIDGLNVLLIGMSTLVFATAILASVARSGEPLERPGLYYLFLMIAESAVLGAFLAQDLALFVAFFDLMLIPFYFLTGMWGRGERRQRIGATIKLVIYTLVGSLLMLAAAIATGVLAAQQHGTHLNFALSALQTLRLSKGSQEWIFIFFAAAFLVKMPAFPLHGWMPDGYRAMPIEVLMIFSGVLSKVGAYGFLAIVLPLFPQASVHFQMLMLLIALASILYGSAIAFRQTDARLIAGYSSIAQLGFITLGIFSLQQQGAEGALLQMVNHGLVVAPLLFIVLLLSRRTGGSEDIRDMGGVAFRAPVLATIFLIVALATLAMPGSANFVGEFLILLGVFKAKLAIAIIGFAGVVAASVYALRLFIRSMHNRKGAKVDSHDISWRDGIVLVPLVAAILFLALYPQPALKRSERSTSAAVAEAQVFDAKTIASVQGSGWTSYKPIADQKTGPSR